MKKLEVIEVRWCDSYNNYILILYSLTEVNSDYLIDLLKKCNVTYSYGTKKTRCSKVVNPKSLNKYLI